MHYTADLEIENEIFPILNYCCNDYAEHQLKLLLNSPLQSIQEIKERQEILKGFLDNISVLKDYRYSRQDFHEVYEFTLGSAYKHQKKFRLFRNGKDKQQEAGRLIQFIHFMNRLYGKYLSRINPENFPSAYRSEYYKIIAFISETDLNNMVNLIQEQKFTERPVRKISTWLEQKLTSNETADFWNRLIRFEVYLSLAVSISILDFSFPSFDSGNFLMEDFYHPLLKTPVKNSITWNGNTILITGPNMSGKSTVMKSAALCIYLAHTGMAVPAARLNTPFFHNMSVFIQLRDNLQNGYSHFMNEIQNLKKVLMDVHQGRNCFAVFDELFRGTNEEDAAEILETTLQGLVNHQSSCFMLSTHINKIKHADIINSGKIQTLYLDCELSGNTPRFSYQVKKGWSDLHLGRILFENEGLNEWLSHKSYPAHSSEN